MSTEKDFHRRIVVTLNLLSLGDEGAKNAHAHTDRTHNLYKVIIPVNVDSLFPACSV